MKRTLELLCIGLVAGGLLTGCPKKEEPTPTPATAAQTNAKPQTAAQAPPQTAAQTAAQEAPVNAENYANALFEVSCVRAKVEDTEKQKSIIDEVYARYGFDEESFAKAQEAMKDKADVAAALTAKMAECTPEKAASFGSAAAGTNAGTAEQPKEEEVKKPTEKKPAAAWKAGGYQDQSITGAKFDKAQVRLSVKDDGKVTGSFQGSREGKGFSIPVTGEMSKDGQFTASGSRQANTARVSGRYKDGQITGAIQGSINKEGFRVNYVAK